MTTYDRYNKFRDGAGFKIVPFINIPVKDTDLYEIYRKNQTKLDNLSYQYYNDAGFGWFIMQANPEFGSLEQQIPDNTLLRIPYPLTTSLQDYESEIEKYNQVN